MRLLVNILLQGILVWLTAYVLTGVHLGSYTDALLVAVVLTLANMFVKPIITILTLPITILTLGLFLLVINGLVVMLVDALLPGFSVASLMWAILFSLVLSVFNYVFMEFYK
jgi:putative membrane protein